MTVSIHLGLLVPTVISITELVFLGSRGSSVHTYRMMMRDCRAGSCSLSVLVCEVQALSVLPGLHGDRVWCPVYRRDM